MLATYIIIALLVLWSSWVFFSKIAPNTQRKIKVKLADTLENHHYPRLAKIIRPATTGSSCSMGCGCSGTPPKKIKQHQSTDINSVKWK